MNAKGLYDRHLDGCIVRRKHRLHLWVCTLVSTGTLADTRTHNKGAGYLKSSRFLSSLPFLFIFLESDQKPDSDFEGRVGLFPGMRNGYTAGLDGLERQRCGVRMEATAPGPGNSVALVCWDDFSLPACIRSLSESLSRFPVSESPMIMRWRIPGGRLSDSAHDLKSPL